MKSRVVFAEQKIKEAYNKLEESTTEDQNLKRWLDRAFDDIAEDAFCGIQIPKKRIPKKYIQKYEIDNLWKYNLPKA